MVEAENEDTQPEAVPNVWVLFNLGPQKTETKTMKIGYAVTLLAMFLLGDLAAGSCQARGLIGHTLAQARSGRIFHDHGRRAGTSEVVASVGRGFGQLRRAKQMWRASKTGHAAFMASRRVKWFWCWRGFCTGRSR